MASKNVPEEPKTPGPLDVKYPNAGKILEGPKFDNYYTLSNGCPIEDPQVSESVSKQCGKNRYASQLIQDINTIDTISHITRERIPERYVHAKGAGAFGKFKVTKDISAYTDANFLNMVGKTTRLFARFSTVGGEKGSADTVRDTKGAAFKLYTEEGNLDWLLFNPEIFLIRDPAKFPSMVHATKKHPQTNLGSADMFWDFFNHNPEAYNTLIRLFTDEGTPKSYANLNYFSVNTYTFTKHDERKPFHFVRIKITPDPAPKDPYYNKEQALTEAGKDPDILTRELYDRISQDTFPKWKVFAQIIDPAEANNSDVNIFDATRVLPETKFNWTEIGEITLDEPPQNFFSQVEQAGFNVANVVPGWDISPDPILQIRLFAYGDTQRYRLGINNDQLPVNRPQSYVYSPTRRDGAHNVTNYAGQKNYINGDENKKTKFSNRSFVGWEGKVQRFKTKFDDSDWKQPQQFWEGYGKNNKPNFDTFVGNVTSHLGAVDDPAIQQSTVDNFNKIDKALGDAIKKELERRKVPNNRHATLPGVVAGGQDKKSFVQPTIPDPATDVDKNTNKVPKEES
ncbi:heme-dependent catalase [Aspergillus ruber CBS 135680]|uniref:Catalase n=1 Tax=Aspergillus ruber (strain CBS 135680) TaxID=1388766 RepID=A0A017S0D5_ASPRC|nr:heme-dependent catalase [Aspergillus ruber CBS 135680]EYE90054.1 heme-dependent catalase [Aspergillus ruber CBS 135680]